MNIIINDYVSKTSKNLDDIYIRQGNSGGLTLFPNQIRGGNFNKDEFTFNSNVYIGTNINDYKLKVFGDLELTKNLYSSNIITNNITINKNLIVENEGICEFKTDSYFKNNTQFNQLNCENSLITKTLNITPLLQNKNFHKLLHRKALHNYTQLSAIVHNSSKLYTTL